MVMTSRDGTGVVQLGFSIADPLRVDRFNAFVREVMLAPASAIGGFAAAVVALDGVHPAQLEALSGGGHSTYQLEGDVYLEWEAQDPRRIERRILHRITVERLRSTGVFGEDSRSMKLDFVKDLKTFLGVSRTYKDLATRDQWSTLTSDAEAWLCTSLRMPMACHVLAVQPMSAVPRECLSSRLEMKKVVRCVEQNIKDGEVVEDQEDHVVAVLDLASESGGDDRGGEFFLKRAIDLLPMVEGVGAEALKRLWISSLVGMRAEASNAGPRSSTILAWMIDLIESGTAKKKDLEPMTLRGYITVSAVPLLHSLRRLCSKVDEWQTEKLYPLYVDLLGQSTKNQKRLTTAMNSFHQFLVEWFGLDPLSSKLDSGVPRDVVSAYVIWPYQVQRAIAMLEHSVSDEYLRSIASTVIQLSAGTPIRPRELLYLRLCDVMDCGDWFELRVHARWRGLKLKNEHARRPKTITEPLAVSAFRNWLSRVQSLGAGERCLVFPDQGDPVGKVYRPALVVGEINRVLRAATGSPRVRLYTLRHTCISLAMEQLLLGPISAPINPFRCVATDAGHSTGTVTFTSYSHLYESPLRHWLNSALAAQVKLSSGELASILKLSHDALRQQASRMKLSSSERGWQLLSEGPDKAGIDHAVAAFDLVEPMAPRPLDLKRRGGGVMSTWQIVCRIIETCDPARVGLAHSMSTNAVLDIERRVLLEWKRIARVIAPAKSKKIDSAVVLDDLLSVLGLTVADAKEDKWTQLQSWLSQEQDIPILKAAVRSWESCWRASCMSLDRPREALGVYELLKTSGIPSDAFILAIRTTKEISSVDASHTPIRDFLTVYGVQPRLKRLAPRARVPAAHLLLSSRTAPYGAALSMKGLAVLMLASSAHISVRGHHAQIDL